VVKPDPVPENKPVTGNPTVSRDKTKQQSLIITPVDEKIKEDDKCHNNSSFSKMAKKSPGSIKQGPNSFTLGVTGKFASEIKLSTQVQPQSISDLHLESSLLKPPEMGHSPSHKSGADSQYSNNNSFAMSTKLYYEDSVIVGSQSFGRVEDEGNFLEIGEGA
jgi:hypothetical protein